MSNNTWLDFVPSLTKPKSKPNSLKSSMFSDVRHSIFTMFLCLKHTYNIFCTNHSSAFVTDNITHIIWYTILFYFCLQKNPKAINFIARAVAAYFSPYLSKWVWIPVSYFIDFESFADFKYSFFPLSNQSFWKPTLISITHVFHIGVQEKRLHHMWPTLLCWNQRNLYHQPHALQLLFVCVKKLVIFMYPIYFKMLSKHYFYNHLVFALYNWLRALWWVLCDHP